MPSSVDGMKKYQANIDEIAVLQREKASLELSHNEEVNKEEIDKANQTNSLRVMLSDARRALRQYDGKYPTLRTQRDGILYVKNGEINQLSRYKTLLLQGFPKKYANKVKNIVSDRQPLTNASW